MIFPITIPGGIVVTLKIKWESWTLRVRKTGSDSNLHKYKDEFWCTNTIKCSQWPLNHSNKETALNVLTCTFNESSSSCPEQTPSRWPMSIPSVHFTCKNKPLCLQFALLVGEECGIRGISLQQHEKWPRMYKEFLGHPYVYQCTLNWCLLILQQVIITLCLIKAGINGGFKTNTDTIKTTCPHLSHMDVRMVWGPA